jgi:tRNA threonylcarbamoyladenosine biosynthesis protein TsaE
VIRRSYVSRGPDDTWRIAGALLKTLPARAVIALHGDLGSGKTCFVQGLAAALGVRRAVTSPTYTVVNEYRGTRPLFHIDLYRLKGVDEVLDLGFEEYFERDGVTAIEWAERAGPVLPPRTLHVRLEFTSTPDERRIEVERPETDAGKNLPDDEQAGS